MRTLTDFIVFIVVVGFVFASVGFLISDFNEEAVNPVNTSFVQSFDKTSAINDTIIDIKNKVAEIQTPETGFFADLLIGLSALPAAVLTLPVQVFAMIIDGGTSLLIEIAILTNVPQEILTFIILIVSIIVVFKMLQFIFGRKT